MSNYTQILYQLIFTTKYRKPTLLKPARKRVFSYMAQVMRNKKCHVYVVNGIEDHVHMLIHLHPTVALSSLVKDVKLATWDFIKQENLLPHFGGWTVGYSAFTYSIAAKRNLVAYIIRQEAHHKRQTSRAELMALLEEHGIEFEERYLK